jgi:hypothetical protein
VALERITGALHGRRGSFILQHNGTIIQRRRVDDGDGGSGLGAPTS